ncbi:MAG: CRISPR-associated helicase Cas3' [Firmicutes bacterium]|nr:CRISPR-associated helicase Cas3' [Bacillota bacterium]
MTAYYAHTNGIDKADWQLVEEHLISTAKLSGGFAATFGADEYGYCAGLLHDLGKFSDEFQQRLEGAPIRVDHSTAGAQEAMNLYGRAIGTVLSYVVSGHHAGIPDYGSAADSPSLAARFQRKVCDYGAYRDASLSFPHKRAMALPISLLEGQEGFSLQFFIRMLYSCLVDADFLDTERVMDGTKSDARRSEYPSIHELELRLDEHLKRLSASAEDTTVNRYRGDILEACIDKAQCEPGLFSLTVPTGGGKTLSSLAFALKHASLHGLERVIYVIPFTSIIEQNARVFRKALGDEGVLEHHSNFEFPDEYSEDWNEEVARLRLATENWDAPVIVTTNVQFFESLFANRSSRCRKLHNTARSVIILDEAQMLPTNYLMPCLAALRELTDNYGSTVVLCTATQPALGDLMPESVHVREIAPDPPGLYEAFRRVQVTQLGPMDDDDLAFELSQCEQALCIVNSRAHARELYNLISDQKGAYHLSACMCPRHRSEKLDAIRRALKDGAPCRVVSTQLVEAGVDLDFPVVFRASAGLDSIAQAAGRCNREGKLTKGDLFVFQPVGHRLLGWFQRTATVADMVLRHADDPLGLEAVESYFQRLYDIEGDGLDKERIMETVGEEWKRLSFPFAQIADEFRVIDSNTVSIVIPWDDDVQELIDRAAYAPSYRLFRKLQQYVVQVYPNQFAQLERCGKVRTLGGDKGAIHVLNDKSCYTEVGLEMTEDLDVAGGAWFV